MKVFTAMESLEGKAKLRREFRIISEITSRAIMKEKILSMIVSGNRMYMADSMMLQLSKM